MPQGLENIKDTLARITRGDSVMDLLMEFERTLDSAEVFAYKNWLCGELVKGPDIGRYWFTTTWMWPHKLMPDPEGALRLEKIGCKVSYGKDILNQPKRILTPKDWEDPRTKEAKIDEVPVWVVTIEMPIKYVTDSLDAYQEYIDDEIATETEEVSAEIAPPEEEEGMDDEFDMGMEDDMGDEDLEL